MARSPRRAAALLESKIPRLHEEITKESWLVELAQTWLDTRSLENSLKEAIRPAILNPKATLRYEGNPISPEWMLENPSDAGPCLETEKFCSLHARMTGAPWLETAGARWRSTLRARTFRKWLWHWSCTGDPRMFGEDGTELEAGSLTPEILDGPLPQVWMDLTGQSWLSDCAGRWRASERVGTHRPWLWHWACTGEPTLQAPDGSPFRATTFPLDLLRGRFPEFWLEASKDSSLVDAARRLRQTEAVDLGRDWLMHWVRTGGDQLRDVDGNPVNEETLAWAKLREEPDRLPAYLTGGLPGFWSKVTGQSWLETIARRWMSASPAGGFQRWTWFWACTERRELRDFTGISISATGTGSRGFDASILTPELLEGPLPSVWTELTGDASLAACRERWQQSESAGPHRLWLWSWVCTGDPELRSPEGVSLKATALPLELLGESFPAFWSRVSGNSDLAEAAERLRLANEVGPGKDWLLHWVRTGEIQLRSSEGNPVTPETLRENKLGTDPESLASYLNGTLPRFWSRVSGDDWLEDLAGRWSATESLESPFREVLRPGVWDSKALLEFRGHPITPDWIQEYPGEARGCLDHHGFCSQHARLTGETWLEEAGRRWRKTEAAGRFREWCWHWARTNETRLIDERGMGLDTNRLNPELLEGPLPRLWMDLTGDGWLAGCASRWEESGTAGPHRKHLWRWVCSGEATLQMPDGSELKAENLPLELLRDPFPELWKRMSNDSGLMAAAERLRRAEKVGAGHEWLTHWVRTGNRQLRDSAGTPVTKVSLAETRLSMNPASMPGYLFGKLPAFWSEVGEKPWLQEIADRWRRAESAGPYQRWFWYWACTGKARLQDFMGKVLSSKGHGPRGSNEAPLTPELLEGPLPRIWKELTGDESLATCGTRWRQSASAGPGRRCLWSWVCTGKPMLVHASGEPLTSDRLGLLTVDLVESPLPEFWMLQTGETWLEEIADRWARAGAAGSYRAWFWHWACTGEAVLRKPDGREGELPQGPALSLWKKLTGDGSDDRPTNPQRHFLMQVEMGFSRLRNRLSKALETKTPSFRLASWTLPVLLMLWLGLHVFSPTPSPWWVDLLAGIIAGVGWLLTNPTTTHSYMVRAGLWGSRKLTRLSALLGLRTLLPRKTWGVFLLSTLGNLTLLLWYWLTH